MSFTQKDVESLHSRIQYMKLRRDLLEDQRRMISRESELLRETIQAWESELFVGMNNIKPSDVIHPTEVDKTFEIFVERIRASGQCPRLVSWGSALHWFGAAVEGRYEPTLGRVQHVLGSGVE